MAEIPLPSENVGRKGKNVLSERCQLLERIDSVTPSFRGLLTNVSKKAINKVLFAV